MISILVPVRVLEAKYPGGLGGLEDALGEGALESDGAMVRVGCMHPDDARSLVDHLEDVGLVPYRENEGFVDLAVVRQESGPAKPCRWLETIDDGQDRWAWMVGHEDLPRVTPAGWYPGRSRSFHVVQDAEIEGHAVASTPGRDVHLGPDGKVTSTGRTVLTNQIYDAAARKSRDAVAMGNPVRARALMRTAEGQLGHLRPRESWEAALLDFEAGRYPEARNRLEGLVLIGPLAGDARAWAALAEARLRSGDDAAALSAANEATRIGPAPQDQAAAVRAEAQTNLGQEPSADDLYRAANWHLRKGDRPAASQCLERAAAHGHGEALHGLGLNAKGAGDGVRAERLLLSAWDQGCTEAGFSLAVLLSERHDPAAPQAYLTHYDRTSDSRSAHNLGLAFMDQGQPELGLRWLWRARALGDRFAELSLAYACERLRLVQLSEDFSRAAYQRGINSGDNHLARSALEGSPSANRDPQADTEEAVGYTADYKPIHHDDLRISRLQAADLTGADLAGLDLATLDLSRAELHSARLLGANLTNADVSHVDMGASVAWAADLSHAHATGMSAEYADFHKAQLTQLQLFGAKLKSACFSQADLSGGSIIGSRADHASFAWANAPRADFTDTYLIGADFHAANLSHANFTNAVLIDADLSKACLRGADLGRAVFRKILIRDADTHGLALPENMEIDGDWLIRHKPN